MRKHMNIYCSSVLNILSQYECKMLNPIKVINNSEFFTLGILCNNMIKTTYLITLVTAILLAAPVLGQFEDNSIPDAIAIVTRTLYSLQDVTNICLADDVVRDAEFAAAFAPTGRETSPGDVQATFERARSLLDGLIKFYDGGMKVIITQYHHITESMQFMVEHVEKRMASEIVKFVNGRVKGLEQQISDISDDFSAKIRKNLEETSAAISRIVSDGRSGSNVRWLTRRALDLSQNAVQYFNEVVSYRPRKIQSVVSAEFRLIVRSVTKAMQSI